MSDSFDYVIAGGGTAGCVLANRLSADPGISVALLEAGPPDDDPAIGVPAMVAKAIGNPRQSWGYYTVPQRAVDDRVLPVRAAGCSAVVRRSTAWCISVAIRVNTMNGNSPAGRMPTFNRISSGWRTMKPHTRRSGIGRPGQCHRHSQTQSAGRAFSGGRRYARPAALRDSMAVIRKGSARARRRSATAGASPG